MAAITKPPMARTMFKQPIRAVAPKAAPTRVMGSPVTAPMAGMPGAGSGANTPFTPSSGKSFNNPAKAQALAMALRRDALARGAANAAGPQVGMAAPGGLPGM